MNIQFTRITSGNGPLTKYISVDVQGNIHKNAAAQLYRGQYGIQSVNRLERFIPLLESATPETAFTYGVPDHASGMIVRDGDLHLYQSAISRTRNFFSWPRGPGVLMIDDDSGLMVDCFCEFLREAVPFLDGVEMIVRPSSSSWISNSETGEWLRRLEHRRAYVVVSDARMIPKVGELIEAYLWLAGHGYYDVSRSGRLLKRCPADTSVWQPERLDFVGGAVCEPPLTQPTLRAELFDGHLSLVDIRHLPTLTERDRALINKLEREARIYVEEERHAKQQSYINTRTEELIQRGQNEDIARASALSAVNENTLNGDFVLTLHDGTEVKVREVLASPARYHGMRCRDPLEPDYRDDPRIAYISVANGGQPFVYSHAHGGCRYRLTKPAKTIQIRSGESATGCDEIAHHLAHERVLFERGQVLVAVQMDGQTREINAASIKYLAGTHCNLQRFDNRSNGLRPTDLPDTIASLLVTRAGHGVFPRLNGVISAPTMTPSGRLIDQPGFDEDTGLLYLTKGDIQLPTIDARPNAAALQEAFRQLWFPFKDFPFDSDSSKSTMVTGLLTSVVRACLPTAPGFGLDAPTAGAGKTKLAQCIAALGTGEVEALLPPPSDDDETRKKISTAVLASKPVIIFDNVEAQLKSPVLAAFLTAPVWSDRMLGANSQIHADNRMLLLVTGNNLSPVGDIVRRLLTIRIDPRLESTQVWQREFELDPLDYVIRNRLRMIAAALTLLSGFIAAGRPRLVPGRLASFENWDDLVRQCVVWLGSQGIGGLIDPVERLTVAAENDPETTRFSALAGAWFAVFRSEPKQLKDIIHSGQLSEVLRDVVECRGVINAKLLGAYLRKRLGKIVDGFRFEKIAGRSNTALWRVVRLAVDGGGFGGCDGSALGHPTSNEISSTFIFGEVSETDPPHPSNPPTGIPKPESTAAEQHDAGVGV